MLEIYKEKQDKFDKLLELYQEYNSHTNISAIREPEEVIEKHFLDSLASYDFFASYGVEGLSLIDIGTGGGFPAIPLAIVFPELKITAVDSVGKKTRFIEEVKEKLSLSNLSVINDRAEKLGQDDAHRGKYDFVVSRAVAQMNLLAELCIPLASDDGIFIAYKKTDNEAEMKSGKNALRLLKAEIVSTEEVSPGKQLVFIKKLAQCPAKYPRTAQEMKKKPL